MTLTTASVNPFGTHRVIRPSGALPYSAERLEVSGPVADTEVMLDVECLNVDSASFTQIMEQYGRDEKKVGDAIMAIVAERGKMHNPVTGSGGVLIGKVAAIGSKRTDGLKVGDRLVTLVSLTTTPLQLDAIHSIDFTSHQVRVSGRAFIFERSIYAHFPADMPEKLAMSILDVCGAPAQTERLVKPGMRVVILGAAGKSGLLCSWVAAQQVGSEGQVIGIVPFAEQAEFLRAMPGAITVLQADATDPVAIYQAVGEATQGHYADLVINCVNVPRSEMSCILACRNRGKIYFFSMATSFQAASLGAESVGQDVELLMGNGYCENNGEMALDLVRRNPALRAMLEQISRG